MFAALLAAPSFAEGSRKNKLWRASLFVLASASAADACTSWGQLEANPLVRGANGAFGVRSATMKVSLTGAAMLLQWRMARRDPRMTPYFATANMAVAGVLTGAAVHAARTR